jgi:hypothetical protein
MKIPQVELDRWEEATVFVGGQLLKATVALERGDRAAAAKHISQAQEKNALTRRGLVLNGATDSVRERARVMAQESGRPVQDHTPPLHLLNTPANRRYARALRDAYEALVEVERERGWEDDLSDALLIDVTRAEQEVNGPSGLRGMEG